MNDYRNASFDDLHAAEKRAEKRPLRHVKVGVAVVTARAMEGAWQTEVPADYIGEDPVSEELIVTCVCRTEVRLATTLTPTKCEGCERWFLDDGKTIRVCRPADSPDSSRT